MHAWYGGCNYGPQVCADWDHLAVLLHFSELCYQTQLGTDLTSNSIHTIGGQGQFSSPLLADVSQIR